MGIWRGDRKAIQKLSLKYLKVPQLGGKKQISSFAQETLKTLKISEAAHDSKNDRRGQRKNSQIYCNRLKYERLIPIR